MERQRDTESSLAGELDRCWQWLEPALAHSGGTHEFEDILSGLESGSLQLWPADDAALITEFIHYPRERHIHVFLAGGNLERIDDMRPHVEAFGLANGCNKLTMTGRPGWAKHYRTKGYKTMLHTVVKDISLGIVEGSAEENT